MGEENITTANEETTASKWKLKKQADKKNLGNRVTKNTNSRSALKVEKFVGNEANVKCGLEKGDHVPGQVYNKDDESILEELIKTRESFLRTCDVCVFSAKVTKKRTRYGKDKTADQRASPTDVNNRRVRYSSDDTVEGDRVTRARSILADATEWSHLGKSTLVFKDDRERKEDNVFHEDTSYYIVGSTVATSGEITPEQAELLKKAQSRDLANNQRSTTPVKKKKKKVQLSKEEPQLIGMSKETSQNTSENQNVCNKLIGNIKKFCSCLPENLGKPSDTDQCKRKPQKVGTDDSAKRDNEQGKPTTAAFALFNLQTPTLDQLAQQAAKTSEEKITSAPADTSNEKNGAQSPTKNKNKRRPSLRYSKLRYNPNSNNDNKGNLKCSVRLTGKDKGDLLITGDDGKTHSLSFKINKDFNIVPDS